MVYVVCIVYKNGVVGCVCYVVDFIGQLVVLGIGLQIVLICQFFQVGGKVFVELDVLLVVIGDFVVKLLVGQFVCL